MAIKPIEIEFLMRDGITPGVGKATEATEALLKTSEEVSEEMTAALKRQSAEAKRLEAELAKVERQLKRSGKGAAYQEMTTELQRAKQQTAEAQKELAALDKTHAKNASSTRSLRTEIRELSVAMATMRLNGEDGSAEYARMARRAAELVDTMGDVRAEANALAHDNAALQGVISGVSGLAGGFTALTGAMSLFAGENEELIRIQTKLQSVMAITMGLQQMANTLNRDSAFSVVTLRRAKELLAGANTRLATSLGISTVAAKALMGTLTLGASVLVSVVVAAWDKLSSAQAEARRRAEEYAEVERSGRAERLKAQYELEGLIRTLKTFVGTKAEEKAMVDELNAKYGESFGYYRSVSEWYEVLTRKSTAYIDMMFKEAKARALIDKAVKVDEEIGKTEAELKETTPGFWDYYVSTYGQARGVTPMDVATSDLKKQLSEQRALKEQYLQEARQLQEEVAVWSKRYAIGGHKAPDKSAPDTSAVERRQQTAAQMQQQEREREAQLKSLGEAELKVQRALDKARLLEGKAGYERERAEAEIAHQEELKRIRQEEAARLQLIQELRRRGAKLTPGREVETKGLARAEELVAEAAYQQTLDEINRRELEERQQTLDEVLSRYQDFDAQRRAIDREYTQSVQALERSRSATNAQEIDAALKEAQRQRQSRLKEVDDRELETAMGASTLIARLFAEASDKSQKELEELLAETKALIDYLTQTPAETLSPNFGFTAEQLRSLQQSPVEMRRLTQQYERLKAAARSSNPFREMADAIREVFNPKDSGSKSLEARLKRLGAASAASADTIKGVTESIGEMFKAMQGDELADATEGVSEAINAVGNIGKGFAQGGLIGGIAAAAGEAIGFITKGLQASAQHRAALKKIREEELAFEREYQLAELKRRLLMEDATTPFGEQRLEKARETLRVYFDALDAYQTKLKGSATLDPLPVGKGHRIKGLMDGVMEQFREANAKQKAAYERGVGLLNYVEIVTGSKKSGFIIKKTKDVYSSLIDVYPQLIDAEGKLNIEMLKTVIATRKMSDAHKGLLEDLVKQHELMEEAKKQFDDYLESTFGGLGSGLTEAITKSLSDGSNAMTEFGASAAKVIEELGEQMLYSLFFADKFKELKATLQGIYESNRSPEETASEGRDLIAKFYNGLTGEMATARAWAESWRAESAKAGISVWSGGASASQSAKASAFATMTQEQGTKLEGLFTSAQVHWASIDDQTTSITGTLSGMLDSLSRIDRNTRPIADIYEEIQALKRDGIKIK